MATLRRNHGFWHAFGRLRLRDVLSVEIISGVLIGAIIAYFQLAHGSQSSRTSSVNDMLTITAALLGLVFAGFSLLVAFLSGPYLKFMNQGKDGVSVFFHPFLLAIGAQVAVVLGAVTYKGIAPYIFDWLEGGLYLLLAITFSAALLDVVALARLVLMQATARALHDEVLKEGK